MTKAGCVAQAATITKAQGFATFGAMHRVVIRDGYMTHASRYTLAQWRKLERAFHTAQMFRWASEAKGEQRKFWTECATARL